MSIILKTESARMVNKYEPVVLENGITLKMSRFIEDEKVHLQCSAVIIVNDEEKELGSANISTASNHMFIQVSPVSHLGVEGTMELSTTLMECLIEMFKAE